MKERSTNEILDLCKRVIATGKVLRMLEEVQNVRSSRFIVESPAVRPPVPRCLQLTRKNACASTQDLGPTTRLFGRPCSLDSDLLGLLGRRLLERRTFCPPRAGSMAIMRTPKYAKPSSSMPAGTTKRSFCLKHGNPASLEWRGWDGKWGRRESFVVSYICGFIMCRQGHVPFIKTFG
jgi:hypothetical protein